MFISVANKNYRTNRSVVLLVVARLQWNVLSILALQIRSADYRVRLARPSYANDRTCLYCHPSNC